MKLLAIRGVMVGGVSYAPGDLIETTESTSIQLLASGKCAPAENLDRAVGLGNESAAVEKKIAVKKKPAARKKAAE